MSIREHITSDIINTLKNADNPRFGLVSRDMVALDKLSRQQFPALYIETSDELKSDISMAGNVGLRESRLSIRIIGWVSGANLDTQRNELISTVENTLENDKTRSGFALNTEVNNISSEYIEQDNYAKVEIIVEVYYRYQRGQA
jgi:hypothetical protein